MKRKYKKNTVKKTSWRKLSKFFLKNKKKESVETIEKPIKSVLDNKRFL